MKICIMGAGAMGCMFGAKYVRSGQKVVLVDGWQNHVDAINTDGLFVERNGETYNVKIPATLSSDEARNILGGAADLVMIFCKGMDTEKFVKKSLPVVDEHTCFLTLQNGIGNPEIIGKFISHDRVFFGGASAGSVLLGPGKIRDTTSDRAGALIHIMPLDRVINDRCIEVADAITKAGMVTAAEMYAEQYVWEKLCLNCCVNAPGVLTRLSLKDMTNDRDGFVLFDLIVKEVAAVAQAKGVDVDYEHLRSFVHMAGHKSPHYASMLQDAKNKRPLELSTITGAIVSEGKKFGIPTPVNETIMRLASMVSNHYEDQWY